MSQVVLDKLKARFGAAILETHSDFGDDTAVVDPAQWQASPSSCARIPALDFDLPVDLCGVDYPTARAAHGGRAAPLFDRPARTASASRRASATRTWTAPSSTASSSIWPGAELARARDLRHERRALRGPPRPAPHPHVPGVRGPPAAEGLPGRAHAAAGAVPHGREAGVPAREAAPVRPRRGHAFGRTRRTPRRRRADRWSRWTSSWTRASSSSRPSRCTSTWARRIPRCTAPCASCSSCRARPSLKRRRAGRLPAPRLREDVRARDLGAGVPVRRPAQLRVADAQQRGLRPRGREDVRHRGARALPVVPDGPRRAGPHRRPPDLRRRHGDGARRVNAVPLVHQGPRDDLGHPRRGDRRAADALVRPHRRHGQAAHADFKDLCRASLPKILGLVEEGSACSSRTASSSTASRTSAPSARPTPSSLGWTGPCLRATGVAYDIRKAHPVSEVRRGRLRGPGRHARATRSTASSCASARSARASASSSKSLERMPDEGPVDCDDPRVVLPRQGRRLHDHRGRPSSTSSS